jgi:hypothetical protein
MERKTEKPRYGRPRLLSPEYERELARQARVESTHGAHGRHYATVAARALFDLDQPGWVPHEAVFAHFVKPNGDLKWSMLSELGRLPDEETVRAVARIVGREHLPTAQAIALIRRIRVGDRMPRPERLTRALLRVIATHCARYPTTSEAEIVAALDAAAAAVQGESSGVPSGADHVAPGASSRSADSRYHRASRNAGRHAAGQSGREGL